MSSNYPTTPDYSQFMPNTGLRHTPYTPWQGLADALKIVAALQHKKKEEKRQNFAAMTEAARAGGISALRKLYSDSAYQSLAQDLRIKLPPLPEPSAGEIREGRFKHFYTKLEASKEQLRTQLGREPTPEELTRIRRDLGPEFFDIAAEVGLPSQDLSKSTMTTLVRSMLTGETDPLRIVTAWEAAYKGSNIVPDDSDVAMFEKLWLSPTITARIEKIKGDAANAWSTAALKDEKAKQLKANFELETQKLQAEVASLISLGKYREAATREKEFQAEWLPKIKAAELEYKTAQTTATLARVDLIRANTTLSRVHAQVQEARRKAAAVESSAKNRKLQYDYQIHYVDALRKMVAETQTAAENESGDRRRELLEMVREYTTELNDAINEMKRQKEWLANETGAIPPKPKSDVAPTYEFISANARTIYNQLMTKFGNNPERWFEAYISIRDPRSQTDKTAAAWISGLGRGDWDELYKILAAEYKRITGKNFPSQPRQP